MNEPDVERLGIDSGGLQPAKSQYTDENAGTSTKKKKIVKLSDILKRFQG